MAEWIEFRVVLRDHKKIHRLARALSIPYAHALGLVACLWAWAAGSAENGNLSDLTDEEFAYAARWEGPVDGFRKQWITCKLIDANGHIHDWDKHGTRMLRHARERIKKFRQKVLTQPASETG